MAERVHQSLEISPQYHIQIYFEHMHIWESHKYKQVTEFFIIPMTFEDSFLLFWSQEGFASPDLV